MRRWQAGFLGSLLFPLIVGYLLLAFVRRFVYDDGLPFQIGLFLIVSFAGYRWGVNAWKKGKKTRKRKKSPK